MTAHQSKKQPKKQFFAVDGRCLTIHESLKSQPHGVQSNKRPRHRSQNSRVGIKLGNGSFTAIRTTSKTTSTPWKKSRSPVRLVRASALIVLGGSESEVASPGAGAAVVAVAARGRHSPEVLATETRRIFVLLSARAARRASLAREMESWAWEAERAASSEAAAAAFERAVVGLRGFGRVGGCASGR